MNLIKPRPSKEGRPHLGQQTLRITLFLFVTYIILCVFVSVFPYKIYDADSSAYSSIARKLAHKPVTTWCAPDWGGHGYNYGLFQEHPPGVLWITALFIRIGIPESSAAFCANFLYIFLSLYFIYLLVSHFGGPVLGWGAVLAYVFTPVFLQYLIRANLEHPLNLAVIAGIYGLVRSEESWKYKAIFTAALVFAFLVKGIFAFILSILALVYWMVFLRSRRTLLFIVLANLFALGTMFLFELWYRQVTGGIGFWMNYINLQFSRGVLTGFNPIRKIYNLIWYLGRAIWFPAPWFFFIFYGIYKWKKENIPVLKDIFFKLSVISAACILFWFSLFDRKADRYIFPVYTFLVLAGVWVLFRLKPKLMQFLEKRKNILPLYLSAVLIIFTMLRIFFHTRFYRFIRFWPG
jgi:4-amino-4-deoxy-L-arabinose transferase-like glycosyltransferase